MSRLIFNTILLISLGTLNISCGQQNKTVKHGEKSIHTNNLIHESSPYLLQHAHNPVNWYAWGKEALDKAKKENKPLIISIGYAACHWCHVMEHESFEDTAVANLMNKHFVAIKVDREERPDIDQIYMEAVQLLQESGGWPLNAFALPDGKPFYAGTYYTSAEWKNLLNKIQHAYTTQHGKVIDQAQSLTKGIRSQGIVREKAGNVDDQFRKEVYANTFPEWKSSIDWNLGGYNRAPKFPLPVGWDFLLQYHYFTGNQDALKAVRLTLDKMALGGIYDQIGGGFARYSTDKLWKVPHFEKMLYDNAQLVSLYSNVYKLTGSTLYKEVVEETLLFIERELMSPEGGFYASPNADSEGEEGKFYVWRKEEIHKLFDVKTAKLLVDYYQVTETGNWENKNNILHLKVPKDNFVTKNRLDPENFNKQLAQWKTTMLLARANRIRPSTDDKILTSWNALMLKGYIEAYNAFGKKEYLEKALANATFLEKNIVTKDGGLFRNYKGGKATIPAFLDDFALLAESYIQLYQTSFDIHWLQRAKSLMDHAIVHFYDEKSGMFYYTSDQDADLVARQMEITDNVIPSSNSVMALNLFFLGKLYDNSEYRNISQKMVDRVVADIPKGGVYYANWGKLLGLMANGVFEVAIVGSDALKQNQEMQHKYTPNAVFLGGEKENLPLLENKLQGHSTFIYICREKVCLMPLNDLQEAL
ncbi:MAG TPA: thioredoxin domain-containing protein, partial [Cytophagaceae bacterium]